VQEWGNPQTDIIKVEEIVEMRASYSTCFNWHEDDGQLEKAMRTWAQVMPEPLRSPGLTNVAWTIYRTYSFKLVSR